MKLTTKIVIGLTAGAALGVAANVFASGATWLRWLDEYLLGPVGQVFLRFLLMTVVPLVFASITLGVAGIGDIRRVGRIGIKTLIYFLGSTALACVIGLILVNLVKPGVGIDPGTRQQLLDSYRSQVQGMQAAAGATRFGIATFVNIVPRNPVQAAASLDMLGVIFFSIVFGAALTLIPRERSDSLIRVIEGLGDVVMKIIDFAMKLAPYGVFALIFVVSSRFGWEILRQLGIYVAVVVVGLVIHASIGLSALVRIFGGMNPVTFWKRARPSVITAFSTASSNATLPTNIAVAEQQLGVPPAIAGFVLPLGATMNMNGTALYEGVAVLFLAQVFGIHLAIPQQVIVVMLSVIMAVGAAGVPGGSLPLLMIVLGVVGVPPEAIGIILGVDLLLDMFRTTLNVTGDLTAALYITRSEPVEDRLHYTPIAGAMGDPPAA